MKHLNLSCAIAALITLPGLASAQLVLSEEALLGLYPGKAYSPYADRSFSDCVFWGDGRCGAHAINRRSISVKVVPSLD